MPNQTLLSYFGASWIYRSALGFYFSEVSIGSESGLDNVVPWENMV